MLQSMVLQYSHLSESVTQCRREMVAERRRGMLGRLNVREALDHPYRYFLG